MDSDNKNSTLYITLKYYGLIFFLCCIYGIVSYELFHWFIGETKNPKGLMTLSFLLGVPLSIGSLISICTNRPETASVKSYAIYFLRSIAFGIIAIMTISIISLAFLGEGAICVFMALPFMIGFIIVGIILPLLLGSLLGVELRRTHKRKYISLTLLAPLAFGSVEQHFQPQDTYHRFEKEILINAPAEEIWPLLLNPQDIKPSELSDGLAYKIGAPYPVGASTPTPEVGAMRHSVWQMGITFDEEITAIRENEYIEWKYRFYDHSFPAGSLDDHIVIGGTYFDLTKTSYSLKPTENGTILTMSVTYRISTNFNWYAGLWGDLLIQDTAQTLLEFYKKRSEAL